jgi:hypothetical protein
MGKLRVKHVGVSSGTMCHIGRDWESRLWVCMEVRLGGTKQHSGEVLLSDMAASREIQAIRFGHLQGMRGAGEGEGEEGGEVDEGGGELKRTTRT